MVKKIVLNARFGAAVEVTAAPNRAFRTIFVTISVVSLASNASDGQMTLFHPFSSDKIRPNILDLGHGESPDCIRALIW